ncbi:MAG: type I-E CRISPR-associated endoribonuclease Cas2 [Syntrophomonadaceae bacterium]|nr:type I-E CRISPR-associated endoribonuclease Cas2 [Syntrophomonadaceae bacterium]
MVVLIIERAPQRLRGEISRWMIEPRAGVYVGHINALIREKLWEKAIKEIKDGSCIMIHKTSNEQGFEVRTWGDSSREIVDFEGLTLVRIPE